MRPCTLFGRHWQVFSGCDKETSGRRLSWGGWHRQKFHDDGGFAVFVVGGGGAEGLEAELLVDGDHGGIGFAAVGDDSAETVLPGVFDLPGFDAMAQALAAILAQESGTLNVEGAGLRGVFVVIAKVFLEVGVVNEGGAAGNLGVDQDPVGFQERPESFVEGIFAEDGDVQVPEGAGVVWQLGFAKLKEHARSKILQSRSCLARRGQRRLPGPTKRHSGEWRSWGGRHVCTRSLGTGAPRRNKVMEYTRMRTSRPSKPSSIMEP